jgi:VanZ family protein
VSRRPPERSDFQLFVRFWLPVLLYVTLILVVAAQPRLRPPLTFHYSDKVLHLFEYGVLGLLLARALRASLGVRLPLAAALMAVAFGVLVGSADETIQRFTPGRESSLLDLAADTVGLGLAQALYVRAAREREGG